MAASNPHELATHYQVLNVSSSLLDSQHDPSILIKRAYRRALLQNHPDKASSSSSQTPAGTKSLYTIDQISKAFAVLSSPTQRAAYDTSLRLSNATTLDEGSTGIRFQTGVENVDLDDLPFDEVKEYWYRSCRCGNGRGYSFYETDLEDGSPEGELMVGCQDCSLWLRVHFAMIEDGHENGNT